MRYTYQIKYMEFAIRGLSDKLKFMNSDICSLPIEDRNEIMKLIIALENTIDKSLKRNQNKMNEENEFQMENIFNKVAENNIRFEEEPKEFDKPIKCEEEPKEFHTPKPKIILNKYLENQISINETPDPHIHIEDSKNPIYNPLNYYNPGDSVDVIKYKIKNAMNKLHGFYKELLSKTQRKKRNQILNAFLKNL